MQERTALNAITMNQLDDLGRRLELAAEIGRDCVIACAAGEHGELDRAPCDYRELCELADGFGVTPALEFVVGGSRVEDMAAVPGAKVALVHANDAPDKPGLTDADRVFCGQGDFPLPALFRQLLASGYAGHFSLELFSPVYRSPSARHVARDGLWSLLDVLTAAAL